MGWPPEATERMYRIISGTAERLKANIPGISYFLYDYNFNDIKGRPVAFNGATSHCCLWVPEFMRFKREECTGLDWVRNVVDGKTTQIGTAFIR